MIWAALIVLAVLRNALRLHHRVGTMRGALLCSVHHYLSKVPATVGQCGYWLRSAFHKAPQPLIEYRR